MSLQSLMSFQSLASSKRRLALVALFLATLLQASASPYYSVAERDGIWWFTAPDGEPFFSLGPNGIGPGGESPEDKRPNEYHYSNHYDSRDAWAEDTLRRLRAWNFNTIAGWSSELLNGKGMPWRHPHHQRMLPPAPRGMEHRRSRRHPRRPLHPTPPPTPPSPQRRNPPRNLPEIAKRSRRPSILAR